MAPSLTTDHIHQLTISVRVQAEFRQQYQTLPTVLSTSAQHNVGRTELLTHMARLRNLNAAAPDTGGVEPDEWEGLAE